MVRLKDSEWKPLSNILRYPLCAVSQPQRGCIDPPPRPLWRRCSNSWSISCLVVSSRTALYLYRQLNLHEPAVSPIRPHAVVTWPAGLRDGVDFLLSSAGYTLQAVLNMLDWWAVHSWDRSQTLKSFYRSRKDIVMVQQKLGWILKESYFVWEMLQENIWLWTLCETPFSVIAFPSISGMSNSLLICYLWDRVSSMSSVLLFSSSFPFIFVLRGWAWLAIGYPSPVWANSGSAGMSWRMKLSWPCKNIQSRPIT